MCASLAGLEDALHTGDEQQMELSIRRIVLIHSIILSIGGIPLIYLGDEVVFAMTQPRLAIAVG